MSDELTQWADAARDYKAKLDWATTALCDILGLASGKKCDPDYTALEGLIAGTVEAVRALKAELEQAHKAAAEMRDALLDCSQFPLGEDLHYKVCSALDNHNCGKDYARKRQVEDVCFCCGHANTPLYCIDCSRKGFVRKSEAERLHDELTRLRDIVSEADVALIDAVLEETK